MAIHVNRERDESLTSYIAGSGIQINARLYWPTALSSNSRFTGPNDNVRGEDVTNLAATFSSKLSIEI